MQPETLPACSMRTGNKTAQNFLVNSSIYASLLQLIKQRCDIKHVFKTVLDNRELLGRGSNPTLLVDDT